MKRLAAVLVCALALTALTTAVARPTSHHAHHKPSHRNSHHSEAKLEATLKSLKAPQVKDDADAIIDAFTSGPMVGVTWDRLANFTDTIGPRVCGSATLEGAVQFMIDRLTDDGLQNVHAEQVSLPYWYRGSESVTLLSPRVSNLKMLGLGGSIGTQQYGPEGLTADVLVVKTFDELTARAAEAKGKIVLFNQYCDWETYPVDCYGMSVIYRGIGAQKVAAVGGLASLIRSVASFSIDSPHTGMIDGYGNGTAIPTAALTIEDAAMLERMQTRGQRITINLKMDAYMSPNPAVGHNVVAEIVGSELPNETVIVSGHLDSWDVGAGAMDDGGGAFISWSVLSVLNALNLRPKRTIRLVMWSCEEFGGIGASQYFQAHQDEVPTMSMVMESDMGVFHPQGLQFTGNNASMAIMTAIGQYLTPINASAVTTGGEGTDIGPWMVAGVPGASLLNENQRYFWYHHSNGDRMEVLNSTDVDLAAAVWAVHAYSVANLDSLLPRN